MTLDYVHKVRVRYGETDQMGMVYHGNYALYFEEARTEMLRRCGITYREVEDAGILMPVREMSIRFMKGAMYDDLLSIRVQLLEKPLTRMSFNYRTFNERGILLNTATIELMFVKSDSFRPVKCPEFLLERLPAWS
ncbi:MAG: acyl-CoA thioesterase [Bacteroidia bacterium]|jgi:acyl-CoA thioester hydrolase